ncbi:MAG: phosphomethylpyrimidine synthase ThiC, partial [Planctomycetes bacterium]|nr:phosphomethylpyrimidine synthase ThiC [Planctomycetota bacterium]
MSTPMEGSAAATGVFPASRKTYVPGSLHPDLRVPMREIKLTPTSAGHGTAAPDKTANPPVTVYDTSGPYTDPDVAIQLD